MKKLANLKGVKVLTKNEQKVVNGGDGCDDYFIPCSNNADCAHVGGACAPLGLCFYEC